MVSVSQEEQRELPKGSNHLQRKLGEQIGSEKLRKEWGLFHLEKAGYIMGLQVYERFLVSGYQLFFITLDQRGGNRLKQRPEGVYMEEFPAPQWVSEGKRKKKKAGPFSEDTRWRTESSWFVWAF